MCSTYTVRPIQFGHVPDRYITGGATLDGRVAARAVVVRVVGQHLKERPTEGVRPVLEVAGDVEVVVDKVKDVVRAPVVAFLSAYVVDDVFKRQRVAYAVHAALDRELEKGFPEPVLGCGKLALEHGLQIVAVVWNRRLRWAARTGRCECRTLGVRERDAAGVVPLSAGQTEAEDILVRGVAAVEDARPRADRLAASLKIDERMRPMGVCSKRTFMSLTCPLVSLRNSVKSSRKYSVSELMIGNCGDVSGIQTTGRTLSMTSAKSIVEEASEISSMLPVLAINLRVCPSAAMSSSGSPGV